MTTISFFVPGTPAPKARPRLAKRHVYTPASTSAYEQRIAKAAAKAMGKKRPSIRPASVTLAFVLPPLKRDCPEFATARGDLDNYVKAALDGLNGVVYADDKQVVGLAAGKYWGDPDNEVGTKVSVYLVEEV